MVSPPSRPKRFCPTKTADDEHVQRAEDAVAQAGDHQEPSEAACSSHHEERELATSELPSELHEECLRDCEDIVGLEGISAPGALIDLEAFCAFIDSKSSDAPIIVQG